MNTCKTCKHWGDVTSNDRLRICYSPLLFGYLCQEKDVPDNGIFIRSDFDNGMQTGCDFGCVLHEVKK